MHAIIYTGTSFHILHILVVVSSQILKKFCFKRFFFLNCEEVGALYDPDHVHVFFVYTGKNWEGLNKPVMINIVSSPGHCPIACMPQIEGRTTFIRGLQNPYQKISSDFVEVFAKAEWGVWLCSVC